jgi:hypothetical protein
VDVEIFDVGVASKIYTKFRENSQFFPKFERESDDLMRQLGFLSKGKSEDRRGCKLSSYCLRICLEELNKSTRKFETTNTALKANPIYIYLSWLCHQVSGVGHY